MGMVKPVVTCHHSPQLGMAWLFLRILEPVFLVVGHSDIGWQVWRTVKTPFDGLLKSELPNATLGDTAVAWIRAVNEGNAFDHSHLGSDAETWVIRTVLIEFTRAHLIGVLEGRWHVIER